MGDERFLVTGALGCVGAWAVKRLVSEGVPVWTYDLGADDYRLRLVLGEDDRQQVASIRGDITDLSGFERVVGEKGITHILHLAALQVPLVRANPVLGAQVNVVGTTVVLEVAKRLAGQIKGLVYASSFGVYGEPEKYPPGPIAHEAPLDPPTLYGVFKQANENTAGIYWRESQVASIGLRPCVVYGPGRDQGWTSTPTKAMLAAALGQDYHISYGGTIVYHHADEVARAMIGAARAPLAGAPVYNLGGATASMDEIVAAIEKVVPAAAGKISFEPTPLPHPSEIDDRAFNEALGPFEWMDLVEGVQQTVDFFRQAVDGGRLDVERALAT